MAAKPLTYLLLTTAWGQPLRMHLSGDPGELGLQHKVKKARTKVIPMIHLFLMTPQGLSHREHLSGGPGKVVMGKWSCPILLIT